MCFGKTRDGEKQRLFSIDSLSELSLDYKKWHLPLQRLPGRSPCRASRLNGKGAASIQQKEVRNKEQPKGRLLGFLGFAARVAYERSALRLRYIDHGLWIRLAQILKRKAENVGDLGDTQQRQKRRGLSEASMLYPPKVKKKMLD